MIKSMTGIILAALVLAVSGTAQAKMMYYTFDGTVSAYEKSSTITFQDQAFSAVFGINFDEAGSSTDLNGAPVPLPAGNFYAGLISTNFNQMVGTTLTNDQYGTSATISSPMMPTPISLSYLYGTSFNGPTHATSDISFSVMITDDSHIKGWGNDPDQVYQLTLGSIVAGMAPIWSDNDATDWATGSVKLTAISDTMPTATPIPGAVWLLGSGLVGLVGLRRKRKAA